MATIAGLYRQYGGGRKTHAPTASISKKEPAPAQTPERGFSGSDPFYDHSWEPAPGQRGADSYADLAAAKADADQRKKEREAQIALEQREAELERREREYKRKQEMAAVEARRQREAEEEAERRRKAKASRKQQAAQPRRPKFNFEKEKPQVMAAVANALQASSNLVNSCRHVNRELENVTDSPRVQDNLDKAKAARRTVIRYIQLVTDEEYVGTLLDANEKVVEAIQLYDKLSKPAALDSDSEHDEPKDPRDKADADQIERIRRRLEAQKLESQRTGELEQLQEQQRAESQKQAARRARAPSTGNNMYNDLQDLDFSGSIANAPVASNLPPPIRPDSDHGSYDGA